MFLSLLATRWLTMTLFFISVVTSQSPAPGSCIHFSYPQQSANCLPFANCSGAQCNLTSTRGHASFVVHKCQDPVTVDLSVVMGNSIFRRQFNRSESVSGMFITMSRNATHLHFEVHNITSFFGRCLLSRKLC